MMAKLIYCLIIICITTLSSNPSWAADQWDEYNKILGKYYFFDNQKINNVTCRIIVSTLNPDKVRELLKPVEKNIKIEENLKDFRFTYDRKSGLSFSEPHFAVSIISLEPASDPKIVEAGAKNINDGMRNSIQGVVQTIEGVFDEFILPKVNSISNLEVLSDSNATRVKYSRRGASHENLYIDNKRKTQSNMPGLEVKSSDDFVTVNGKLFLSASEIHMKQGDNDINVNMIIRNKDFGKIVFPTVLEQQFSMSGFGIKTEGKFTINFTDCKIE